MQVGKPSPLGSILGVTDPVTKHRSFATYIAYLSHLFSLAFNPLQLEDDWILGIWTAEGCLPFPLFPRDISTEPQGGGKGKNYMEGPVAEVLRGKVFEDELITWLQTKGTDPSLQDFLHPYPYLEFSSHRSQSSL